jgi:Domain of unknown function (DUF4431)
MQTLYASQRSRTALAELRGACPTRNTHEGTINAISSRIRVLRLGAACLVCCGQVPEIKCRRSVHEGQLGIGRARDAAGRPETPYILRLFSNTCLDADDRNNTIRRVRTIHMFPADENMRRTFRLLVGKTVVVRGSPSVASTAHHHAPIVMHVTKIDAR